MKLKKGAKCFFVFCLVDGKKKNDDEGRSNDKVRWYKKICSVLEGGHDEKETQGTVTQVNDQQRKSFH